VGKRSITPQTPGRSDHETYPIRRFRDADVLQIAEVPEPELRLADLLVRVRAAGLNRADLTQRRGGHGRPDFGGSTLLGLEIAGEVIAAGPAVSVFAAGDRVMRVVGGDGYAEVATHRLSHGDAGSTVARHRSR
jgi:NADPH:quinone reductase-like Zn-dependent oxidoreductase